MVIAECSVKETGTGTPRREPAAGGEDQSSSAEVGIEARAAGTQSDGPGAAEEENGQVERHQGQAGRSGRKLQQT